jgi:hypothetical protein
MSATKRVSILDRADRKDYLDIAAILQHGTTLAWTLGAAQR